jgi:hypothetical protein
VVLVQTIRVAVLTIVSFLLPAPLQAETLHTRDQNPLLSGFGLTTPWPARFETAGHQSLRATLNWSSTASIQESGQESLELDAEGREWRLDWQYALSQNITLRVELPYQSFSGGSLDGFIDGWHSAFGLPEGARPLQHRNQYRIEYAQNGTTQLIDTRAHSGIGNMQVEAGYQAHSSERNATSIWITGKLPTQRDSPLSSSAFDMGGGVASEWQLSRHWNLSVQAALLYLGRGHVLPDQQHQWLTQGFINCNYLATSKLTLSAQFEAHSAAFRDSNLKQFDSAWIVTLGGTYRFNQHWRAQLGVSEDIKVESSPDVNFLFSLSRSWR